MTTPTLPDVERQTVLHTVEMPGRDEIGNDPDNVAHYVDQRKDQDVTTAIIEGTELIALCGHRWVPSRDPKKLPVCQPCVEELIRITGGGA